MGKGAFNFSLPNWGKIMDERKTVRSIVKIAQLGFDGIEFYAGSPYSLLTLGRAKLVEISETLEQYEIEPVSIMPDYDAGATDWWRTGKDFYSPIAAPQEFAQRVEESIKVGHELGCRKCNIHTMNRPEQSVPKEKAWRNLVSAFSKCAEVAEEYDLMLCSEVEPGMVFSHEDDIFRMLEEVRSDHYGVLVDSCLVHVISGGKPAELVAELGSKVSHVHVSDQNESISELIATKDEKINCPMDLLGGRVTVGTGVLDLQGIMATLLRAGYRDWVTIENAGIYVNADESVVAGREYIRELLESLQGR